MILEVCKILDIYDLSNEESDFVGVLECWSVGVLKIMDIMFLLRENFPMLTPTKPRERAKRVSHKVCKFVTGSKFVFICCLEEVLVLERFLKNDRDSKVVNLEIFQNSKEFLKVFFDDRGNGRRNRQG